jgi:copper chaperone
MTAAVYQIAGMTCAHCVAAVTAELTAMPGVLAVAVDLEAGTAAVESAEPLSQDDVAAAIDEAGYELMR